MSKNIQHIKKQVINFIQEGEVDEALDILLSNINLFIKDYRKYIYLLSCRYNRYKIEKRLGLINDDKK